MKEFTRKIPTSTSGTTDEERRFITKEFAESLAGKTPSPYFRLHDPVQKMLVDRAASIRDQPLLETAYPERMIHFWREVSLAGVPRTGRWMDECFALLFEASFDLAEAEPDWALECVGQILQDKAIWQIFKLLSRHTADRTIGHASLVDALATRYAHGGKVTTVGRTSIASLLRAAIAFGLVSWPRAECRKTTLFGISGVLWESRRQADGMTKDYTPD